jgi:hypothetical protein
MRVTVHTVVSTMVRLAAAAALLNPRWAFAQQPQQDDTWVAVSGVPAADQLPAAPLLIAAYVVVLVAFFVYVGSIAKRLNGVQRDVDRLEGALKERSRS